MIFSFKEGCGAGRGYFDFCLMSILKIQYISFPNLYLVCAVGKEREARFGTSCKYFEALIINIESKNYKDILLGCLHLREKTN